MARFLIQRLCRAQTLNQSKCGHSPRRPVAGRLPLVSFQFDQLMKKGKSGFAGIKKELVNGVFVFYSVIWQHYIFIKWLCFEGRPAFEEVETARNKLLSRARVHVERFNERIKKFRIISGIVPLSLTPLLSQIVFITCCLANFKEPLAK